MGVTIDRSSHARTMATVDIEKAKATLTSLFNQIDTSGNEELDAKELSVVFGEFASEFLKYCDVDGDKSITLSEWLEGITGDVSALTEAEFEEQWVTRMQKCIVDAGITGPSTQLFCMGNPLLDISATVDPAILEKYELKANDAILVDEGGKHAPLYDDLKALDNVGFVPGGATQNSARVAQALLVTPKSVAYVGCVGKDEYADTLRTASTAAGVDVAYMVDEATPTGKCGVLITDGGAARSLVTDLAAANNYKIAHAQTEAVQARIKSASVYYSAGFFQTVSPDTMISVATHAAESEQTKIFSTNLSAPFLMFVPPFFQAIKDTLPLTDILFCNEAEAETFRDGMAADEASGFTKDMDLKATAMQMAAMPKTSDKRKRMAVITQGADPTIVAYNGVVAEFPVIAIAKEDLVDTNGAGDAFVGGFLAKLVMNNDATPAALCAAGNYAANVIIQRDGCTYPTEFALPQEVKDMA